MLPGGRAASPLPGGLAGGEGLGLAPPGSGGGCSGAKPRRVCMPWHRCPRGDSILTGAGRVSLGFVLGVPAGEAAPLCRELLAACLLSPCFLRPERATDLSFFGEGP